jgi:hypothetical protein
MLKKGNEYFILAFVIISILLIPFFVSLFEKITGTPLGYGGGADIGFGHSENIEGFLFSSAFFFTLAIILFTGKNRYFIFCLIMGLEFLPLLLIQDFEMLLVGVFTAIIAIILGETILFTQRKISVKK